MKTSAARNQDSVQASLSELRQLHVARVDAEREAARQERIEAELQREQAERLRRRQEQEAENRRIRHAQEAEAKRLAAAHELELAKEQARIDAASRLQEKRLAVELKKAEAELARDQAIAPARSRSWPLLMVAAVLLGLQGALFWQLSDAQTRIDRVDRAVAEARDHDQAMADTLGQLETSIRAAEEAAHSAQSLAAALEGRVDALAPGKRPPKPKYTGQRPARPRSEPRPRQPLDMSACAGTPLGCLP